MYKRFNMRQKNKKRKTVEKKWVGDLNNGLIICSLIIAQMGRNLIGSAKSLRF
jgi:hypothetical protein